MFFYNFNIHILCLNFFFTVLPFDKGVHSGYFGRPNITHIYLQGTTPGSLPDDNPDKTGSSEDICAYKRKISRTLNRAKPQRRAEKVDSACQSYCEIDEIEPGTGVEKVSS